jgi:hypothetical protein
MAMSRTWDEPNGGSACLLEADIARQTLDSQMSCYEISRPLTGRTAQVSSARRSGHCHAPWKRTTRLLTGLERCAPSSVTPETAL